MKEEVKEETKFVATLNEEGRVSVKISGPHVNKRTFNRLTFAMSKAYKQHIRDYRKQIKRDMLKPELDAIVAEPVSLDVSANGKVLDSHVGTATTRNVLSELVAEIPTSPITEPIAKVVECKKLNLNEMIEAKREKARKLAETKL